MKFGRNAPRRFLTRLKPTASPVRIFAFALTNVPGLLQTKQQLSRDTTDTCTTSGQATTSFGRHLQAPLSPMQGQSSQDGALARQTQQAGDIAFLAFTNYLHFKTQAQKEKNLSNDNLESEVPGNHPTKQQVTQQTCTAPDREKTSCM